MRQTRPAAAGAAASNGNGIPGKPALVLFRDKAAPRLMQKVHRLTDN
jgi:hypothetical protein